MTTSQKQPAIRASPDLVSARPGPSFLKHTNSLMFDLHLEAVEYDDAARTVTISANAFDSYLVGWFATSDLREAGILVFRDETNGPPTTGARWQLFFSLAGVLYECDIALQTVRGGGTRTTTSLRPRG
ncbi:hypothetical protein QTI33_09545 [Variovorax sp. J22P271]|uniref:hypothetical protein n=1 Tax=Variovorax davisae TaxID=3053515 RepID=UPI0025770D9C|nr:hypothetical protein [Variovorax sp. J22P271]MDM0032367.1 hypothetical protein [Variovorax sp. J22P271]